ncbi:unnamed protein product [Rotaria sp. Silwood1]|nr:unnamed protein product [Rotaria sp. Silwood1]CAF1612832.1 unnamed protein product [Rotaria sp. Silwood1]CAF3753181.1 unnamed protein product [Rotaria sp. Silwood1]CAF3964525.1 unnamed protein product [Rotaria sp. Silwood1]
MKHESLKLKDIRNVVKGLFIHLYNALHLLVQSCDELNIDKKAYRLCTVVSRLVKYIDILTNWYVKLNQKRFKGTTTFDDCLVLLNVLCYILLIMAKLMAPSIQFLSEYMYQIFKKLMTQSLLSSSEQELSVHFKMIPKSQLVFRNCH